MGMSIPCLCMLLIEDCGSRSKYKSTRFARLSMVPIHSIIIQSRHPSIQIRQSIQTSNTLHVPTNPKPIHQNEVLHCSPRHCPPGPNGHGQPTPRGYVINRSLRVWALGYDFIAKFANFQLILERACAPSLEAACSNACSSYIANACKATCGSSSSCLGACSTSRLPRCRTCCRNNCRVC